MKYFNLYYIAIIGIACLLWKMNTDMGKDIVSFYGFAENKETEINFNYPVSVGDIKVQPGDFVKADDPLLSIYRIKAKETLDEEPYKMAELQAKERIWQTETEGDIKKLETQLRIKVEKLHGDIKQLEKEKEFGQSLYKDLNSLSEAPTSYQPISDKINALQKEILLTKESYQAQIDIHQEELKVGKSPYTIELNRLKATQQFKESTKKQLYEIKAPSDGLIGNIHCKEAEHIPSYKTLVTFYEPNPTLVKGFVQEDLLLHVAVKDSFIVRSTKDPTIFCYGVVTGLGSRIIEIPERLRKIVGLKTYGREVLVSISPDNQFLQKEKVILEFVNPPKGLTSNSPRKSLVELQNKE